MINIYPIRSIMETKMFCPCTPFLLLLGISIHRYTFLGYIIGISLRTKHQMSMKLPSIIWKYIVGDQPDIEDLKEIDDVFVSSLTMLKEYIGEDEEDDETFDMIFELKFSLMDSAGNEIELIPGGSQV